MAEPTAPQPSIDQIVVQSIGRWALVVTASILVFDTLVAFNYPFPVESTMARGAVYSAGGVALVLATVAVTFLGYRVVTMRVARRARAVYPLFLPAITLISSVVAVLLLAAPA